MDLLLIIYTVIGLLIFQKTSSLKICSLNDEFSAVQIILFYSPLNSELIRGQISIYWNTLDFIEGDILNLYYSHPEKNGVQLFSYRPTERKGVVKTKIPPSLAYYGVDSSYTEQCTGYYGAWKRNNTIRKISCLSTHPDWMSKHRSILSNMSLASVFIPGTHNSGAYSEELPQTIIQRYTVTQSSSVLDQLISGVRYLDLRPCIIENKYWICHGRFAMQPLDVIIENIKYFVSHTEEIVIVSFKEFSRGFADMNDHSKFMVYLLDQCKDFLAPRPLGSMGHVTLGELWESKRRLIFSYTLDENLTSHFFWPKINQEWGDVKTIEQLEPFIEQQQFIRRKILKNSHKIFLSAMMVEITLDTTDIIVDVAQYYFGRSRKSLRELGVTIGELVTDWYNEKYHSLTNIVAVDFVDATGIVETAIYWNKRRGGQCLIISVI